MNRYPGIRPFRTDERALFFGRTDDTERLLRLIRLEKIVILYGKSGYGKSSLLQAGVCPRLLDTDDLPFRELRLGPYKPGESTPPALALTNAAGIFAAGQDNPALTALADLFPEDNSLWFALKKRQLATGSPRFLFLFDQFEELFTYPPDQVLDFKRQLAEALYTLVPDRYGRALAKNPNLLTAAEQRDFYAPLELKVVFSIRADRMSQLNTLKDQLPNLLQHAYLLDALDESQATEAITAPALLPSAGDFDTPPFRYDPIALRLIFKELRDAETGKIETSALQIVCRHVEDSIVRDYSGPIPITIGPAGLEDIKSIFRQFYDHTIATLPEAEQAVAHHLVEDLLIKEGVRLPFAEQALLAEPGVSAGLLRALTAASLLRVERDEQGRMLYEVGHDTLVGPISEAAKARREMEEKERLQQEADEQRREKEKAQAARRKARLVAIGAIILAAMALLALLVAWQQYQLAREALRKAKEQTLIAENQSAIAKNEKEEADRQRVKANSSAQVALEKTKLAEDANKIAEQSLQKAIREEINAKEALSLLGIEKAATEEQRQAALNNYKLAQEQTKRAEAEAEKARQALLEVEKTNVNVVQNLLRGASSAIYHLDYEGARDRLHDAARLVAGKPLANPLGSLRTAIADSLLEPAYFYAEADNYAAALFETGIINQMLDLPDLTNPLNDKIANATSVAGKQQVRAAFRTMFQQLRPTALQVLEAKYYPVMLPIPGGTFYLTQNYQATLSDYKLARTETTVWQYNLYLAAQDKDIFDDKTIPRPGWGWEGDNPILNVGWYDAVRYANWVSQQRELTSTYVIDTTGSNLSVQWIPGSKGYHLPTEAQWEYAARGGLTGIRDSFNYAGGNQLDLVGWYYDNSGNRTHAVAQMLPNQLGLYDMSGNVWEWCWDWYDDYPTKLKTDWRGPDKGDYRVYRGGGWGGNAGNCRAASRAYALPTLRYGHIGFRLACSF